mgnify:CR=1 FL=1
MDDVWGNKLGRFPLAGQKSSQHARRALGCPGQGILAKGSLDNEGSNATDEEIGFTGLKLHDVRGMIAVDFFRAEKLNRGDNVLGIDAGEKMLLDRS